MRYLAPFAYPWIISVILIGLAGFLTVPTLMIIASALFVLLTRIIRDPDYYTDRKEAGIDYRQIPLFVSA
jgi:hypothetical protein